MNDLERANEYVLTVFGEQDEHLAGIMPEAVAQGLPDISIGPAVGRLLMILTSMTRGQLAVEVGTLAGYSAIWIARGLKPGGRLVTIELDPRHADFADAQFTAAGVADRVELRRGAGLDVLPQLLDELGPASVDVVFLDAIKEEYPDYWRIARTLVTPGGLVLADNAFGGSSWSLDDPDHPRAIAMDRFNRTVAADPDFEAVVIPLREGVLVARRND